MTILKNLTKIFSREQLQTLITTFLISLIYLFNNGYRFGSGNHTEILIAQYRDRDPSYLSSDIYLNTGGFDIVRGAFIKFLNLQHWITGLEDKYIYFANYFITLFLTILALFLIARNLEKKTALVIIILLIAILLPEFDIGSVYLIPVSLLPVSYAIPLGLFSIYLSLNKKYLSAGILIAIGTFFHLLLGALITAVIFIIIMSKEVDWKGLHKNFNSLRRTISTLADFITQILPFVGAYLIIAGPLLILTLFQLNQIDSISPELFREIIMQIRLPHHYAPSSFPINEVLIFFFWQSIAIVTLFHNKKFPQRNALFAIFIVTNIMFLFGYLFVEIFPINIIIKLQLFRISFLNVIFIKFILLIRLFEILENIDAFKPFFTKAMNLKVIIFILTLTTAVLVATNQEKIKLDNTYSTLQNEETYQWIKNHTPKDALFIVPTKQADFRLGANRAIVGDFKSFTFSEKGMSQWYERFKDLCGFEKPACTGFKCDGYCSNVYKSYSENDFRKLISKYNADYILTYDDVELTFDKVYEDNGYKIFKVLDTQ